MMGLKYEINTVVGLALPWGSSEERRRRAWRIAGKVTTQSELDIVWVRFLSVVLDKSFVFCLLVLMGLARTGTHHIEQPPLPAEYVM